MDLTKVLVRDIMHPNPIIAKTDDSWFGKVTEAREQEKKLGVHIRLIPVIDSHGRLIDVLDLIVSKQRTRLEVVLMTKAKLESNDKNPGFGVYNKCTTYEAVCRRRQRYDTTRYAYELEKYAALKDIIMTEFGAITKRRRLDELYMALTRGQNWTRSCNPPNELLQQKLNTLSKDLENAKTYLIVRYISEAISRLFVGNDDAAKSPDIVFVLGCVKKDEQESRVLSCATFLKELIVKKQGLPTAIVLSGGGSDPNITEAKQMADTLMQKMTNLCETFCNDILLFEEDSLDTVGNAVFGQLTLIGAKMYSPSDPVYPDLSGAKKICVFTSDYHAHRALGLFQRVFHNSLVAVRYARQSANINDLAELAIRQLDSEARANSETFSLQNPVTGMSMSITEGHVQSLFF